MIRNTALTMQPLQPGDPAPSVSLPSHERKSIELADYIGKQPVLLLFFPLAFTSTCTEELCTISDDFGAYEELGAQVFAISVDSPYVLELYRRECGATYPFLSDFNREAAHAFGVLRADPVGPGLRNASDRAAFVIGREGTITYTWHSRNPSLLPPFDELKEALRAVG